MNCITVLQNILTTGRSKPQNRLEAPFPAYHRFWCFFHSKCPAITSVQNQSIGRYLHSFTSNHTSPTSPSPSPPDTSSRSSPSSYSRFHQHQVPIYPEDFVNKQAHLPVLLLYAANHTLYHSTENTPTSSGFFYMKNFLFIYLKVSYLLCQTKRYYLFIVSFFIRNLIMHIFTNL